jgi:di/tricarboxylate transporter
MQRPETLRLIRVLAEAQYLRFSFKDMFALVLATLSVALIALLPNDLSLASKMALGTFALTGIGWTLTHLNKTFVALFAASGLMLSATINTENFFTSLGNSIVWLMMGVFIIASALNKVGITTRIIVRVVCLARSVGMLFYLLTAALLLIALFVPSSTVRAALIFPIYQVLAIALNDEKITRALALMLPINIMLTAVASLVGAGAHLVITDALGQLTGSSLSLGVWVLMGAPFAALSAFGNTWLILRLFLNTEQRRRPLDRGNFAMLAHPGPFSRKEWFVLGIIAMLILLWATEWLHGVPATLIMLLGAMILLTPPMGVLTPQEAAKSVAWELILFVAATLAISAALVETGTGQWLVHLLPLGGGLLPSSGMLLPLGVQIAILGGITAIALSAHLYIESRVVRGAILAPLTVLLAYNLGLDPLTAAFVTAAGIGYCLNMAGNANPLRQFQKRMPDGRSPFAVADLARLNNLLAPAHFGLILAFGILYWPLFGVGHVITPVQAAERLQIAPIKTGKPGLLEGGVFTPDTNTPVLGIRNIGGASAPAPVFAYSEPSATAQMYTLTITAINGVVISDPASDSYPTGQEVYLQATPQPGYRFVGWEMNGIAQGNVNPVLIRIDTNTNIVAHFAPLSPTAIPVPPSTTPVPPAPPTAPPAPPTAPPAPPTATPVPPAPPTAPPAPPTATPVSPAPPTATPVSPAPATATPVSPAPPTATPVPPTPTEKHKLPTPTPGDEGGGGEGGGEGGGQGSGEG